MSTKAITDCSTTPKAYLIDRAPPFLCGHNSAGEGGKSFCYRLFRGCPRGDPVNGGLLGSLPYEEVGRLAPHMGRPSSA